MTLMSLSSEGSLFLWHSCLCVRTPRWRAPYSSCILGMVFASRAGGVLVVRVPSRSDDIFALPNTVKLFFVLCVLWVCVSYDFLSDILFCVQEIGKSSVIILKSAL